MVNQLHDGEPKIHGVIFAHADAGIRSVPAIIGKSVASADEESTFGNYMPKAFLYDQGIRLRNLKQWAYVGAHDATVKHVVERTYDVGAANSNVVAKAMHERNAPLVILHHMESISFPWVTSPNMPPKVVDSIKNRLLSLRDPSILRKIDGNLTGLEEANAADYDKFEKDVMKKADGFDREESSTNLQLKSP